MKTKTKIILSFLVTVVVVIALIPVMLPASTKAGGDKVRGEEVNGAAEANRLMEPEKPAGW